MIKAFPKIFTIGQDYIKDIFNNDVEITEKIDGSQWDFGKVNGELYQRSKGKIQIQGAEDKMFNAAANYIQSIEDKIPDNTIYFCEFLSKPHHNVLKYSRVPKNNLILFGVGKVGDIFIADYETLQREANLLDIDIVPLLYKGKVETAEFLKSFLDKESILSGTKIEGIVVKNYEQPFLLGGQPIPIMMGKFVSEAFKEVHREQWGGEHTHKGKWDTFKRSFCTEARWQKAVQHLKEKGELENSPRDIGKLILEIKKDITEEEQEDIKQFLWKEFGEELLRSSARKFPEWYKEQLLEREFDENAK
jgi:hypothetical protein